MRGVYMSVTNVQPTPIVASVGSVDVKYKRRIEVSLGA